MLLASVEAQPLDSPVVARCDTSSYNMDQAYSMWCRIQATLNQDSKCYQLSSSCTGSQMCSRLVFDISVPFTPSDSSELSHFVALNKSCYTTVEPVSAPCYQQSLQCWFTELVSLHQQFTTSYYFLLCFGIGGFGVCFVVSMLRFGGKNMWMELGGGFEREEKISIQKRLSEMRRMAKMLEKDEKHLQQQHPNQRHVHFDISDVDERDMKKLNSTRPSVKTERSTLGPAPSTAAVVVGLASYMFLSMGLWVDEV